MKYILPLLLILLYIAFYYSYDHGYKFVLHDMGFSYNSWVYVFILFLSSLVYVISNLLFINAYIVNLKKIYGIYFLFLLAIAVSHVAFLPVFYLENHLLSKLAYFVLFIVMNLPTITFIWLFSSIKFKDRPTTNASLCFYGYCIAFIATLGFWVVMNAINSLFLTVMYESGSSNSL